MESGNFKGGAGLIQDTTTTTTTTTPNQRQNPAGVWYLCCLRWVHSLRVKVKPLSFSLCKKVLWAILSPALIPKKSTKTKSHVYLQSHFFSISLFVSNPDQQHTSFRLLGGEDELEIQERACSANGPWFSTKMKRSPSSFNVTSDKLPFQTHKGGGWGGGGGEEISR